MTKKITFKEAKERFNGSNVELYEEEYKGWSEKCKFYNKKLNKDFWAKPNSFYNKNCHKDIQTKFDIFKKSISFEEAEQIFHEQDRIDIKLCKEDYNSWNKKSKFYDFEAKDYFWCSPYIVLREERCHPSRNKKIRNDKLIISLDEAKKRIKKENRKDIIFIENTYCGWKNKAKFYDKEYGEYFWTTPYRFCEYKSCHPKRSRKNNGVKISIPFKEARRRFEEIREDVVLLEKGYEGWKKKANFWDNIQQDCFSNTPQKVLDKNICHPKRSAVNRSIRSSIVRSKLRGKYDNIDDIELLRKSEYKRWVSKSIKYKDVTEEYFWSLASKIIFSETTKPKVIIEFNITAEEAEEKFKDRHDIKLIKYCGWTEKSRFYDYTAKEHFWAVPRCVYNNKASHAKKKHVSKNQLKLYNELYELYPEGNVLLEKIIRMNDNINFYFADVLISQYKIIIEYNGDYWHCSPLKYKENFFHPQKQKFAKDIWKEDKQRKILLEDMGYKVFIIWEKDYKKHKEQTLIDLKEKINNIIKDYTK